MKTRVISIALAALMLLGVLPACGQKADPNASWPDFHGPNRDNISPETGLLKEWPVGGPKLVWKYTECGIGYAGVSIAEGRIYTAGDFDESEMLLALDLDGRLLWKAANGKAWPRPTPGARATPTYSDGALYHMNPHGRLAAFEARSGKELWAVDTAEKFAGEHGIWAYSENVVVDGERVLCMPGGPKGRVVALDKRTGKTLWANTEIEHSAAYCSPRVSVHGGVRQLITMTQKTVVGVDVATGKLLWTFPFLPTTPQNALTPVYRDGYVFVGAGHSTGGTLFKLSDDSRTATPVWYKKELDTCHGGALYYNGKLYGVSCRLGGKQFFCVDFLTGDSKQADTTLGKVGITCAEGMLYCLNHQGRMSLVALKPNGFEIVGQFDLPKKPANSYLAHPVICGGRLYVRYDQLLYVFDVRETSR